MEISLPALSTAGLLAIFTYYCSLMQQLRKDRVLG